MDQELITVPAITPAPFPGLLVRLHHDLGKLPATISIEFPQALSTSLIRRRLATPLVDLVAFPDLCIDEDDLEHIDIDLWNVTSD